jgi:hypothetical protein
VTWSYRIRAYGARGLLATDVSLTGGTARDIDLMACRELMAKGAYTKVELIMLVEPFQNATFYSAGEIDAWLNTYGNRTGNPSALK